ncbi:MAG: IS3 family transposase [Sandaracinaceae bacterium]|nr:IS3 family transposase [Sandaracinaceae bacterium]
MASTTKPRRRRYTQKEREDILAAAQELGVNEAARRHGVPQTTLSNWRSRGRSEGKSQDPAQVSAMPDKSATAMKPSDTSATSETTSSKPVARSYTPSEKAQVLEHAAAHGVSAAHKKFGVSRFTIYDWQRKLAKAVKGEGPSPTSGPAPSEIEAQRDREILGEWHKHPGLGPSQIKNQLRRRGIKVAVSTTRRVMQDAGYRPPKVKREPHEQRFEAVRPNHLWHLDFVHRHIHRASTFTLILIDDCSRFVTGHGVDDAERAEMVMRTFEEAVERHGKPERVMHDRGAAFWSWRGISRFTSLLEEMEIEQVVATHKEHNGKIEVFNANLHKELFDKHRFYDLAEMKRRLASHLDFYNHGRTHHALGGLLVPADRYYGRAAEVLARIEAGAHRDAGDLDLRERCLELFKVVSRDGAPEVWLLGQRLNVPLGT